MNFKWFCKSSWWFILFVIILILEPFIFWWVGKYSLCISTALIAWLGAIILIIVFFMSWHDIKKVYNQCQKDIKESNSVNNNKY